MGGKCHEIQLIRKFLDPSQYEVAWTCCNRKANNYKTYYLTSLKKCKFWRLSLKCIFLLYINKIFYISSTCINFALQNCNYDFLYLKTSKEINFVIFPANNFTSIQKFFKRTPKLLNLAAPYRSMRKKRTIWFPLTFILGLVRSRCLYTVHWITSINGSLWVRVIH